MQQRPTNAEAFELHSCKKSQGEVLPCALPWAANRYTSAPRTVQLLWIRKGAAGFLSRLRRAASGADVVLPLRCTRAPLWDRTCRCAVSSLRDSFKSHPKAFWRRCCGPFLKLWPSSRSTSALAEETFSESMLRVLQSAAVLHKPLIRCSLEGCYVLSFSSRSS